MIKTIENLAKAFVWESQARNRYTIFAKKAKKEWFLQIAKIFEETAEQEAQHAKWLYKMILEIAEETWENVSNISISVDWNFVLGSTLDNLKAAIWWENYEWVNMYPEFAKIAEQEWFIDVAKRLRSIAVAEKYHEQRYQKLFEQVWNESVFEKQDIVSWTCTKCWYTQKSKTPPEKCPSCDHEKNYFEISCENY